MLLIDPFSLAWENMKQRNILTDAGLNLGAHWALASDSLCPFRLKTTKQKTKAKTNKQTNKETRNKNKSPSGLNSAPPPSRFQPGSLESAWTDLIRNIENSNQGIEKSRQSTEHVIMKAWILIIPQKFLAARVWTSLTFCASHNFLGSYLALSYFFSIGSER